MEEYPIEFASDFRQFYSVSYLDVGTEKCIISEAYLLLQGLLMRPESYLTAHKNEWTYPLSWEGMGIIQVQNAVVESIQVNKKDVSKKQKMKMEHPSKNSKKKKKKGRSREDAAKILSFSKIEGK